MTADGEVFVELEDAQFYSSSLEDSAVQPLTDQIQYLLLLQRLIQMEFGLTYQTSKGRYFG
jgi:hypothetical protein